MIRNRGSCSENPFHNFHNFWVLKKKFVLFLLQNARFIGNKEENDSESG